MSACVASLVPLSFGSGGVQEYACMRFTRRMYGMVLRSDVVSPSFRPDAYMYV